MEITVARHCVSNDPASGLSELQQALLDSPAKIRIAEAPTGAGKSYAFQKAVITGNRVLFIVPTRRLAQNLAAGLRDALRHSGWSEKAVFEKLALWNSDETKRLQSAGETNITSRRIREINSLNYAIEGGEMIIAVPEVISHLLLRRRMENRQTDVGIFDVLSNFEHIVFDEFHTISPRGFGLAGVIAKLAAEFPGARAKVSFLSATPLDIQPVLEKLGISTDRIVELHELLTSDGRPVHGNVRLSVHECADMIALVRQYTEAIQQEIRKNRQVIIIYNTLADLQRHRSELERIFQQAGIRDGRVLLIDSIDDSRIHIAEGDFFEKGRFQDPEKFDVLVATSSVEMGVTFRADLMLMEPGFEPLNFLQRYGRAARGNHDGHVAVRYDEKLLNKNSWLRNLKRWIEHHDRQTVSISDLTQVLTQEVQKQFKAGAEDDKKNFGRLPVRAAYSAGLYWNALMGHFSNQKHRWKHLQAYQPQPAKTIYGLLQEVRKMEADRGFGQAAKNWCDRFENEARILRDIGKGIRVVESGGETFHAQELWLRRETDILDRFPILIAEDGKEEVRIDGKLEHRLLETKNFVMATRNACFPHTSYTNVLRDDAFIVEQWCREFKKGAERESLAWNLYPESVKAAELLVRLTGLIVGDEDEGTDAGAVVM